MIRVLTGTSVRYGRTTVVGVVIRVIQNRQQCYLELIRVNPVRWLVYGVPFHTPTPLPLFGCCDVTYPPPFAAAREGR